MQTIAFTRYGSAFVATCDTGLDPPTTAVVGGSIFITVASWGDVQLSTAWWLTLYSHAKLAMMALSYEQARRLAGTGITLNVAYPGGAATAMTAGMTPAMVPLWMRLIWPLFGVMMGNASPARAARSSVFLASSPDATGVTGAYYDTNSRRAAWPKPVLDDRLRGELWALSRRLLGLGPERISNDAAGGTLAVGAA